MLSGSSVGMSAGELKCLVGIVPARRWLLRFIARMAREVESAIYNQLLRVIIMHI